MRCPKWYKASVFTTGGKRYDGKVFAADKEAAKSFAKSWANAQGFKVGFVSVV